ncbi:S1C family serine protease [Streptomyces sp. H27-D2]|uniref:S1C family serine protease n=1 Tax=Streptomyces sp. H27-D2 TaxID=3046304 RepID=UPI002DBA6F8A|nr:trypsin-like peptidase domain-containing protein [Streptomyces sp. H27-D2]MEC4019245.1 trypsin-like peptidase domain-containing protein [Streptomyces sp. H27-D2]
MDEGKATGPRPKWWSRPRVVLGDRPAHEEPRAASASATGAAERTGQRDSPERVDSVEPSEQVASVEPVEPAGEPVEPAGANEPTEAPAEPSAKLSGEPSAELSDGPVPASGALSDGPQDAIPGASAGTERPKPLHEPDPYSTPPYGGPGPWAPAPPVQRPVPTPAQGTPVPPHAAQPHLTPSQTPAYGTPHPAPRPPHVPQQHVPQQHVPQQHTPQQHTPQQHTPQQHVPQQQPHAPQPQQHTQPQPQPQPHPQQQQPHPPTAAHATGPAGPTARGGPGGPAPYSAWQQYDPWAAPRPAFHSGALPQAAPPRQPRRGRLLAAGLAVGLLAGCVGGGIGAYVERNGGVSDVELPQTAPDKGGRSPESVAGIAATALPGVVTLHVKGSSEQGTGTGFVLDEQGHILTNNHVVEPAGADGEISVTFNGGQVAKAKVVGRDSGYDLAVVKVSGVSGLRPLTLGNSESVRVGDPVVAIGAPFDLAGTVTTGIISAKERPITAGGGKEDGSDVSYVDALQTDAPINPGNSGGPLVDGRARVIGINSAIRAADNGSELSGEQGGSIGLGFAIPINQGKRVAEELINTGKATHPVIGVTLDMEYTGDGARVSAKGAGGSPVTPDGPGDKAGIRAHDVITEVDGEAVHSGEELIVKIRSHRPGDKLRLTVRRNGADRTVELTLGSASSD